MAGNNAPASWDTIIGKPPTIAEGNTKNAARDRIGAGTSDLKIGTTDGTAKEGSWLPTWEDIKLKPEFLQIGNDKNSAKRGDWKPTWDDIEGKPNLLRVGATSDSAMRGDYQPEWKDIQNKPDLLTIGTTASTAKMGSWKPDWSEIMNKPVVAEGATKEQARESIDAGTSNLVLGSTSDTAMRGDWTPRWEDVRNKPSVIASGSTQEEARLAIGAKAENSITNWDDVKQKPLFIASGSTAQAAREAIGAQSSDYIVTWQSVSDKPAVMAVGATQAAARSAIGAGTSNLALGTTATTAKAGNYFPVVSLGTITLTQTATIALSAGLRSIQINVPGALTTDNLLLFPTTNLPAGYTIHSAIVTASDTVSVLINAPLLALGATYSIPCRVIALRP